MYMLEGISSVANFIICSVFFVSKGNLFGCLFYYTAAGVSAMWRW